jgi:hypothetical protein
VLVVLSGLAVSSCIVHARPVPVVVYGPPLEYGYRPLLYNGYVVYYSDDGVPFYWNAGVRVWIPVHARARYVTHWRTHHRSYRVWHKHRGHHYRTRRYRDRSGRHHKPTLKPKRKPHLKPAHRKPTLVPAKTKKPTLKPAKGKPTLKPKKKKKPTLRPADD